MATTFLTVTVWGASDPDQSDVLAIGQVSALIPTDRIKHILCGIKSGDLNWDCPAHLNPSDFPAYMSTIALTDGERLYIQESHNDLVNALRGAY